MILEPPFVATDNTGNNLKFVTLLDCRFCISPNEPNFSSSYSMCRSGFPELGLGPTAQARGVVVGMALDAAHGGNDFAIAPNHATPKSSNKLVLNLTCLGP
jgi:hypothetical protein